MAQQNAFNEAAQKADEVEATLALALRQTVPNCSVICGWALRVLPGFLIVLFPFMLRASRIGSALVRQRQLMRAEVEGSTDCSFAKDGNGRNELFDAAAAKVGGIGPENIVGQPDDTGFSPLTAAELGRIEWAVLDGGMVKRHEEVLHFASRETRKSRVTKGLLDDAVGGDNGLFGISRRLVELMGGQIHVDSMSRSGSVFDVRLPLIEMQLAPATAGIEPAAASARLAGFRILATEHAELDRLVLENMLISEGAGVVLVRDARQAAERVQKEDGDAFDLVQMDIRIPEMDGYEATGRLGDIASCQPIVGAVRHLLSIVNDVFDPFEDRSRRADARGERLRCRWRTRSPATPDCRSSLRQGSALDIDRRQVPHWLRGGMARVNQALLNSSVAAVKVTERGGIVVCARLVGDRHDKVLICSEGHNTGPGIAPQAQPHWFHAFGQAETSTTRRSGGTGLGLAITRLLT